MCEPLFSYKNIFTDTDERKITSQNKKNYLFLWKISFDPASSAAPFDRGYSLSSQPIS